MIRKTALLLMLLFQLGLYSQELKVMTYNIRYANETDGENSWSKRKDFLADQIKFYAPDAFGVQEAKQVQMEFLDGKLSNYDFVGVGRDDGKTGGEYSAIFYNTDKLEVLKHDTFWLSETPEKPSKGWDAAYPRICTYAEFRDKETGKKFWYFNTHFDHVGEVARRKSAKLIWEKIQELKTNDAPAILSGDFNLEPETESIQFLSSKMKDSKEASRGVVFGPSGTFNGYKFEEPVTRRIDYIFVSEDGFKVNKYAVLSDSKDLKYASDHLPVYVELEE